MMICLEHVIDADRLEAIRTLLDNPELFASGSSTAGRLARGAKHNLQGKNTSPEVQGVIGKVREALLAHAVFNSAVSPAQIGRVLLSRYEPGMDYGLHFDEAYIEGQRTDLSFTLFLAEPASYEGGELEIHSAGSNQAIKLPAGCAVVYPSDQLHRVLPVTSGVRLAAVGWIRSRVRSAAQRQILFDLAQAAALLADRPSSAHSDELTEALLLLRQARNNLLRRWGDD